MRPTVVYRCYDAEGELLYVGLSGNLKHRVYQHQRFSPWWSEVARVEQDGPMERGEAIALEREQIGQLQPRHNRQHIPAPKPPDFWRSVAGNIAWARWSVGHTQESLARALGCGNRTVQSWEIGEVLPTRRHLEALSAELGREPAWFYAVHDHAVPTSSHAFARGDKAVALREVDNAAEFADVHVRVEELLC